MSKQSTRARAPAHARAHTRAPWLYAHALISLAGVRAHARTHMRARTRPASSPPRPLEDGLHPSPPHGELHLAVLDVARLHSRTHQPQAGVLLKEAHKLGLLEEVRTRAVTAAVEALSELPAAAGVTAAFAGEACLCVCVRARARARVDVCVDVRVSSWATCARAGQTRLRTPMLASMLVCMRARVRVQACDAPRRGHPRRSRARARTRPAPSTRPPRAPPPARSRGPTR